MGTGHDTNLFKIADKGDDNRIAVATETFDGKLSWWVYWNRKLRTYISTSGGYFYYPNNTFANEWQWRAKAKTSYFIKRRSKRSPSYAKLNFTFGGMQIDQIFTNRVLGGENFIDVNDNGIRQRVQLGDLFDRISYYFGGGMALKINKRFSFFFELNREIKDYKNIGAPATPPFFSLDNTENNIEVDFIFKPSRQLKIKMSYDGQDRLYKYKLARDNNGTEVPGTPRRYWTNVYGIDIYWKDLGYDVKVSATGRQRTDKFSGYFNYLQTQFAGDLILAVSPYSQITLGLEGSWKEYDRLTLNGTVLKNRYFTFEAGIIFQLHRNLLLEMNLIHDREISTFEKFNYRRNIVMVKFKYAIH